MEPILRVAAIYFFLLLVFRAAGKRTLSEATPFDLVMLLVLSETTQEALVGDDRSLSGALVLILTFAALDVLLSHVKMWWHKVDVLLDDMPLLLVDRGRLLQARLDRCRVGAEDILHAARAKQGLRCLADVEYAVLETDGEISIIPRRPSTESSPPVAP